VRGGDVDLNHDEIGLVVQVELLDVLVLDLDLVVRPGVGSKRREAERREERILDRAKERGWWPR
jgi:hypothetical protein